MRPADLTITIPGNPCTQNAAYARQGIGKRLYLTQVARDWKEDCRTYGLLARNRLLLPWPQTGMYDIDCWFYFENPLSDANNPVKLLLDSFEGVLYEKDRQVRDCLSRKRYDREDPRTIVRVYKGTEGKLTWT